MTSHLEVRQCTTGRMGASHSAGIRGLARGARRTRWPHRRRSERPADRLYRPAPRSGAARLNLRAQRNGARHRHAARMADAKLPSRHSQRRGHLRRPPAESRTSGAAPGDRCIITSVKATPAPKPNADRLEHRFLRGEPARQALDPIDPIAGSHPARLARSNAESAGHADLLSTAASRRCPQGQRRVRPRSQDPSFLEPAQQRAPNTVQYHERIAESRWEIKR